MNADVSKATTWLGDVQHVASSGASGEVYQQHHAELDVVQMVGSLTFDHQVEAAELLESFERPTFVVFDSEAQQASGWELVYQSLDLVRHQKRLPVAMLLIDGLGRALDLASLADVAFVVPESRVGMYGARTEDGELATGWRWDGRRPARGRHWNLSAERLLWLRDNAVGAEAAEHLFGLVTAEDQDHAIECFSEVCRRHPRR